MSKVDLGGTPLHFIGIGGIGMSALAQIAAERDIPVSGSDVRDSHITRRLESLGAQIFLAQEAANLNRVISLQPAHSLVSVSGSNSIASSEVLPQVICSTAIAESNPEYQAAKNLGCPIFHRSDLLAALIDRYSSIAVSGTHGKTTTSSMIGYMLFKANLDPTIIVGGEVDAWQGNARVGQGEYLVAEADESDGSLVKHSPAIGIITNIELDHPDRYSSLDEVVEIFETFASQCDLVIGCLDDEVVRDRIRLDLSYSLDANSNADYIAKDISYGASGSSAEIWERGQLLGTLNLQLLGNHNLSNALSAVAVGRNLGLSFEAIASGLSQFSGTKRRFETKGEANQIKFIDDYAHHPKEISVTLAAAKLKVVEKVHQRVIAVFQPHRYSRTETFLTEFAASFENADVVVVTDIYSAGEANPNKMTGETLVQEIRRQHPQVHYHPDLTSLPSFLQQEILLPKDLVLFLGAGNLNQYITKTIELY